MQRESAEPEDEQPEDILEDEEEHDYYERPTDEQMEHYKRGGR